MTMVTTIGTLGATLILIAFCLNRFKVWDRDSSWYDLTNIFGGILLTTYAFLIVSIPFLILNAVWTVAALLAFVQNTRNRKQ